MSINRIWWVVSLLIGSVTVLEVAQAQPMTTGSKVYEYTIKSGDTLSGIAQQYHSSVKAIEKINGFSSQNLLRPGQKVKVPIVPSREEKKTASSAGKASKKREAQKTYKVQAGDTPSQIAEKFGISTAALLQANAMQKNALIRIGQTLKIPTVSFSSQKKNRKKIVTTRSIPHQEGTPKKIRKEEERSTGENAEKVLIETEYVVKRGDTLFSIARKYRSSLNTLMRLNGLKPTDVIKPGQVLKIPGQKRIKTGVRQKQAKKRIVKEKKTPPLYYTVRHGDTLWKIANRYSVTIEQIRRLNGLRHGYIIRRGQRLMVKAGTAGEKETSSNVEKKTLQPPKKLQKNPRYYTVKHGDTLWDIARREKLSLSELRKINQLKRGEPLRSGMKLIVGYTENPPAKKKGKVATKIKAKEKRVAKAKKKAKKVVKKKIAKKTKKSPTKVASKRKGKKKSANRRINNAMAILNGKGSSGSFGSGAGQEIIRTAKRYLGRRYVWGAEGPSSFDCSGFTQYVMKKSKGVTLPRISRKQAYYGKYVSFKNLRPGDLIFFDTSRSRRGYVNHVGIYIGNGKFIHASSARHRVVITSFKSHPFYRARFKWGRRVN